MKKILTLCAGILLVFGLAACDESTDLPGPGEEPEPEVTEPEPGPVEEPDGNEPDGGTEPQYIELTLGKYEYELEVNSEEELVVSTNTPASITFSSTDDTIAFAGEKDGSYYIYSGLVAGDATITVTATADGWEKDSKDVKVTVTETPDTDPVVTGIAFDDTSYEVQVGGESLDFSEHVTVSGTNNPTQEFTLTSSDTTNEYITINENVVTAVQATIEDTPITLTATRVDHGNTWTATAELTVIAAEEVTPEVTSITFNNSPYSVTYQPGQANTLDLSSAVTVTGNETLTDTSFTITCDDGTSSENEYISILNNVVTIQNPTSSSISIKAYANADPSKTADGVINVSDGTEYVTDIAFEGIEGNEITLYTGNTDDEHPGSASVTATVTPTEAYETGYDIVVENTSVAKWENNTLEAVAEGTTKITATSTGLKSYNGQPATCEATVTVQYLKTPVSSITLSPSSTSVYSQGSFTIGPSDSEADIKVTINPADADERGWIAKASEDNKLTVSGPAEGNIYTVVAEELADGSEVDTSSIVITPTGYANADVSATLSVSILPSDCGVTHVTAIELTPSTKTAKEGDTFTIGTDVSADVSVSVLPEGADNQNYSVTCDDNTNITVSAPDEDTGNVTVTANKGAGGTEVAGQTYNIVVTAEDTMCSEPATLVLTVARPESEPTRWEVSGGENLSLDVPAVDAPAANSINLDEALTITIYDQYNEPMDTGDEITGGYTITYYDSNVISVSEHTISAVAGTEQTSTTITISSTDVSDTATLTISLTAVTYDAESVTFNSSASVVETVEWGKTLSGTVVVTPSYVTETGYAVTYTSGDDIFTTDISGDTLTFTHNGTTAGTGVYTITSTDGKASCTVTLTVEPQVISIASAKFADTVETTAYKNGTLTLSDELIEVTYEETSLTEGNYTYEEYGVSFAAGANATIVENTATFTTAGEAVINATVTGKTSNVTLTAELKVTVSAYVESITLSADPTTIEGGSGTVTITATLNSDATNTALTWSSSNESVISTSGVGTGTSIIVYPAEVATDTQVTITATAQDGSGVSNTITITVTAPIPTTIDSYTLSFTFSDSPSISGLEKIYIVGSWMDGQDAGAWDLKNLTTELSISDSVYSTTLTNVEIGEALEYAIVVGLNSNFSYTDYNADSEGKITTTVGDYPWYANTIVYEGSVTPEPDGNNYSSVTKTIATGANINLFTNPGWSDAMYMDYTIALQDTGEIGATWSKGSFYFDGQGSNYSGKDSGGRAQKTLIADTLNDYSYDFYYDYGSVYAASNDLGFVVAPDEWEDDLYNDGLTPTEDLSTAITNYSGDSEGEPFASYVGYGIDSNNASFWAVLFWNMYEAGENPFPFVNNMAMVLDVDFDNTEYETWSAQAVVSGFHFVINGNVVAGISE